MFSKAERLKHAAEVLQLQDKICQLECLKEKTPVDKEKISEKIKIAERRYQSLKNELLVMCARKRFVEFEVEMALT